MKRNSVVILTLLCTAFSAHAQDSASIAIYNADTNNKIADINGNNAAIPYTENLELRVTNNVDFDWFRIRPNGSDCNEYTGYGSDIPTVYSLTPADENSVCSVTVDAMKAGPVVNASTTYSISFTNTTNAGDSALIEIFDADTNSKIADFNGNSAEIPYTANLELRIRNNVDFDWFRVRPNGTDCNEYTGYGSELPTIYALTPTDENSVCSITVDAMKAGPVINASTTYNLSFSGGATTPDPTPDPSPNDGNRIDYTQGTNDSRPYIDHGIVGRSAHGNRIYCTVSHFSYDDPILFPGQPGAAHLHMFFGNKDVDAYTDSATTPFVGASTCEGGINYRSGLWIPALYNAQDEVVIPDELVIYYKKFGNESFPFSQLQVIPQGLMMLASQDTWNATDNHFKTRRFTRAGKQVMKIELVFPSCVATHNGNRTGNPILNYRDMSGMHRSGVPNNQVVNSHVSYPGGPSTTSINCPSSHPYGFVQTSVNFYFDEASVGSNPYLSSDMMENAPNMSTLHADYLFGLDETVNQKILDCVIDAKKCNFNSGNGDHTSERWYNEDGEQLYNLNKLLPSTDTTPFGANLPPMNHP